MMFPSIGIDQKGWTFGTLKNPTAFNAPLPVIVKFDGALANLSKKMSMPEPVSTATLAAVSAPTPASAPDPARVATLLGAPTATPANTPCPVSDATTLVTALPTHAAAP